MNAKFFIVVGIIGCLIAGGPYIFLASVVIIVIGLVNYTVRKTGEVNGRHQRTQDSKKIGSQGKGVGISRKESDEPK